MGEARTVLPLGAKRGRWLRHRRVSLGLGVSVLLRQADSFEGFGFGAKSGPPDEQTVAHAPSHPLFLRYFDALDGRGDRVAHNPPVAEGLDFLRRRSDRKRSDHGVPPLSNTFVTSKCQTFRLGNQRPKFDLWVNEREE